jgi:signal transduction histidine kinase
MSRSQQDDQRSNVVRGVPRQGAGADVHEHVIEQLSAVRLTLRGVEATLAGGPLASRLRDGIAELDDATEQLRAAARRRLSLAPTGDAGLAGRLLEVVMETSPPADSAPNLYFSGMDVALPDDVEADLRAVLRQALTHVEQQTTEVEVRVAATAGRLTAQVTEYGTGTAIRRIDPGDQDSATRDDDGAFSVERQQPGTQVTHRGTRMTWTVPLGGLHAVHARPATAAVPAPRRAANGEAPRA